MKFETLEAEYSGLWATMVLRSSFKPALDASAQTILSHKARYSAVAETTGTPWFVIGLIHQMEAGGDFSCHLHNGDSLRARTRNVPANRPITGNAPYLWEVSACDALIMHGFDKVPAWSIERIAFELERYNGWGYRNNHKATLTPYLWSGTTHYARGKYVADGRWDASAVSAQSGAMALLKTLMTLDTTVQLNAASIEAVPLVPAVTTAESFVKADAKTAVSRPAVAAVSATMATAATVAAPLVQSLPPAVPDSLMQTINGVQAWTAIGDQWLTIKTWAVAQPVLAGTLSIGVSAFYLWSKRAGRAAK